MRDFYVVTSAETGNRIVVNERVILTITELDSGCNLLYEIGDNIDIFHIKESFDKMLLQIEED